MKEISIKVGRNGKVQTPVKLKDALVISHKNFRIKKIIRLIKKIKFEPNTPYKLDICLPPILERSTPVLIFWLLKIFGSKFASNSSLSTYLEYNWLNHKSLTFLETRELILSRNYKTFRDVEILLRFLRSYGFTHINLDLELETIQARLYSFKVSTTASI
jgi:hypothetical protein